jgi:hypothetical protein
MAIWLIEGQPSGSSDGPVVRMVDRELVREEFYTQTAADGTPEQKWNFRRMQFSRVADWAERQGLISAWEIGDVTYLWLTHSSPKYGEKSDACCTCEQTRTLQPAHFGFLRV